MFCMKIYGTHSDIFIYIMANTCGFNLIFFFFLQYSYLPGCEISCVSYCKYMKMDGNIKLLLLKKKCIDKTSAKKIYIKTNFF